MATNAARNQRAVALPLPQLSLSAVTSTGAGTDYDFVGIYPNLALQVSVTGTTTNVKVILEGTFSTDLGYTTIAGSTWDAATEASGQAIWIASKPVRFLRAVSVTHVSTASIASAYIGVAP